MYLLLLWNLRVDYLLLLWNLRVDCFQPLDQKPLRDCDLLLMSGLTQTPTANPDAMIGEFCVNTGTVAHGLV